MGNNAIQYIINSIAIVLTNVVPLVILLAFTFISLLTAVQETLRVGHLVVIPFISIIIYPLVFGQYSEIALNNRKIPYSEILKRHWFNYTIVSLVIGTPSLFIKVLGITLETNTIFYGFIFSTLVFSLAIYVLPLVFMTRQKWQSLKLGIKCAIGNFKFSMPLIAIVVFFSFSGVLVGHLKFESEHYFQVLIYVCYVMVSLCADLIVFIAATLILKDKVLT